MTLKFSSGNRKLHELAHELGLKKTQVVAFDLPAGHTCPAADICLSMANRQTGKITDGANAKFRCYAASGEAMFPSVRAMRWDNYTQIKESNDVAGLILKSIPARVKVIRVHSSGDFFNKAYFMAWVKVANARPDITIFGYTKVIQYVSAEKPANFKLVYSMGGKMDSIRTTEPACHVVKSEINPPAPIACKVSPADDFNRILAGESFSLLLHGTQPARVASPA